MKSSAKSRVTEMEYRALLAAIALSQLHVRERSSNSSPEVDRYLACVNLAPGNPWCQAFNHWTEIKAELGMEGICPPTGIAPLLIETGSCSAAIRNARQRGLIVKKPKLGDKAYLRGGPTGHFHTGRVLGINGNIVWCIEGNTNAAGSANGDGVYIKARHLSECDFITCWAPEKK